MRLSETAGHSAPAVARANDRAAATTSRMMTMSARAIKHDPPSPEGGEKPQTGEMRTYVFSHISPFRLVSKRDAAVGGVLAQDKGFQGGPYTVPYKTPSGTSGHHALIAPRQAYRRQGHP